jgi:hypothetical protein
VIPIEEALGSPPLVAAGSGAGTLADLQAAVSLMGMDAGDVPAVVLVGEHQSDVLPALLGRLPEARVLLVGARGATLAGFAQPSGLPAGRCFLATTPAPEAPNPRLALVAELVQFFAEVKAPPNATLVLAPATGDDALTAVVEDFCSGFSAGLFAELAAGAALPTPVLRAIADVLFEQRDLYHALKYYFTLYVGDPAPPTGWRILECLADLGASEWVVRWLAQPIFSPDFRAQIKAELGDAPTASARLRSECLQRNLGALARFPAVKAAIEAAAEDCPASLLYLPDTPSRVRYDGRTFAISRDDYPLLVAPAAGGILRELNPPPTPRELRALGAWLRSSDQPHAAVLGWVRNAWAAEMLLSTRVVSGLPGWQRLVFLVEPDAGTLAALLGVLDLSRQLRGPIIPEVGPFVGPDAEQRLLDFLRAEADYPTPGVFIGDGARVQAAVPDIQAQRVAAAEANRRAFDGTLGEASLRDTLAALKGSGRPLRVAIATTLYSDVVQHAASDLAEAFRHLGHTALLLRERTPGQVTHYQTLTAQLAELRPDFVVLINHTRAEAARFHPRNVPYVTWIQDELPALKAPSLIAGLGPLDFTFGFSPSVAALYRTLGHPNVGLLPFATSRAAFAGEIPNEVRDEVVFPTHLSLPRDPDATPGLLARLEQRFIDNFGDRGVPVAISVVGPEVDEALRALSLEISEADRQEARFAGMMLARAMERIAIADRLLDAGVPLALYGKGWNELPRFAAHHRGPVAPGEPLRQVLRGHKVVLHLNRGCNVHPRVLEGFAAGGFVIGKHEASDDAAGDTCDQFAIGRELMLWHDDDELLELIARARSDEAWRRSVIEAARTRILRDHTYERRAEAIVAGVAAGLERR